MEIRYYDQDVVKPIILKGLDYVALMLDIDKDRDLHDEYLNQITFGNLKFKYWMFVLETCVLNMPDIMNEICTNSINVDRSAVKEQLLGMILMINPHVYDEERGWHY